MSKWYTQISWAEAAHLDEKTKADLMATLPEYQRDSRSKGIPVLGSGLIYPMAEDDYLVSDFAIPSHYKRAWALDTGWNCTAAVWGALDPDSNVCYLYSCYKRGNAEPETHAAAIKARGKWIPGVGDAADISKIDGKKMISIYRDIHGLDIVLPIKAVEAGIYKVWCALTSGGLKVFRSLTPFLDEIRFYSRDANGQVVKKNDHIMDCVRYLFMSGLDRAKTPPLPEEDRDSFLYVGERMTPNSWMAN
jgi:hypothetical protein